jgi:alanyl-tRNA synthetase
MKTDDIRRAFLEFFAQHGHEIVASDSLVPKDDPTLLFTGAGMNQFKEKFLGRNITYNRAASSQKCLRTGDLENVGRTSGHHTFFEMLGNFSFGDYFKKDAILWAWEFMTKKLKIDAARLWVSVYKDDDEAYGIWKDIVKAPAAKIMKFGEKENFWPSEAPSKGPNGPCGPCSEIFYDYGSDVGCRKKDCTPACGCGRFVEVWNLVFTQFDRQPDGSLKPLPNKNIDTGMGLERIASVMQGVRSNFEIDIFKPITEAIASCEPHARRTTHDARRINAIADHIRAVTFMICDGVMPSNEERGYVARKLIRRSIVHAKDLGAREPFLYKLVTPVVDAMKAQYPELAARRDDIAQVVKREEQNFLIVLKAQLPKVEEAFSVIAGEAKQSKRDCFGPSGLAMTLAELAFNFYDTYGMPYDLLEEAAEKSGVRIDRELFESLLDRQRDRSRSGTKIKGEIFSETFAKKVEALGLRTEFLGYENSEAKARVLAVLEGGEVILDKTPFYGESGGQAGDWGRIETASGAMEVKDAKKIGDTIVHIGKILKGAIKKGEDARVAIDETVRAKVMRNHTATHLLQAALRKVLGDHVRQTGSFVGPEGLRFDFTHMKKMEPREVERTEELVNSAVKEAIPVKKEIKTVADAKKEGAIALFGEKYGEKVRVVTVGAVSKELCGGTHVDNTKDIKLFKITGESSIASGVRRIEAVTAEAAEEWIKKQKESLDMRQKAEAEKDAKRQAQNRALNEKIAGLDSILAGAKEYGGIKVIIKTIEGLDMEGIRTLSDKMMMKEPRSVIVLAAKSEDGKASFIISVSETLKDKIKAGALAKELAALLKGSGGGRDDFAQGGSKDASLLNEALAKISETIKHAL